MKPSVCAVCLYADRAQFIPTMLQSFRSQDYENKHLLIYDNGLTPFVGELRANETLVRVESAGKKIGRLRNEANDLVPCEIIAHWDSDDWSHPGRISEQVGMLESSNAAAVGYRDMLFWSSEVQQAWLYLNNSRTFCLGSSLAYWQTAWQKRPFQAGAPANPNASGEDWLWSKDIKTVNTSSITANSTRMVCRIHRHNSQDYSDISKTSNWKRAPIWDSYCREKLSLPI